VATVEIKKRSKFMNIMLIPIFICLFSFLAYKKWSPILLGPVMALLLVFCCQLPVLDTMLGPYLESSAGFVKSNFFVFFLGAIFGGIMEVSNAAKSIAVWMSGLTKGKFVLPLIMTITGILAFGGVSGFVVYFTMYPIALHLCKESNISRALIPGAIAAGCWTWAMTAPGAPSVPNVLAMKALGTSSTADLIGGIIFAGVLQYIMVFAYLEWQKRRYEIKGLGFVTDEYVEAEMNKSIDKAMPNPFISLLPLIVIIVLFNVVHLAVEIALTVGVLSGIVLLYRYGGNASAWLQVCNKGANNSATVILNTAMVVGFAGVMKTTTAFSTLVSNLGNMSMSPLVYVAITSALCAAAAASASGGMGVALEAFKETYLSFGISPEIIHRIAVIAGGTFDSLPHTGGQITLLNICRQSHKDAYLHMFVTECIIPLIVVTALIIWHSLGF